MSDAVVRTSLDDCSCAAHADYLIRGLSDDFEFEAISGTYEGRTIQRKWTVGDPIPGSVLTLPATRLRVQTATTQPTPASPAPGQVLTTPNYVVTIIDKRDDADDSDTVTYIGVSRRTGKSIRLVGGDFRRITSAGPGRILGYIFKNGNVTYRGYREGELQVVRGDKILLDEHGTWN